MAGECLNPTAKRSDIKSMRCELQSSLTGISSDLKTIDNDIDILKDLATESYEMLVEINYKKGLNLINSSYHVFLKGLRNYEKTHNEVSGFIFELQTNADTTFKEHNIRELLNKVAKNRGTENAKYLATYVFLVRAKYLQIVTAYYCYDNDKERVEVEFESFKKDVMQLQEIHKELFDVEFCPREPLKIPCVSENCSKKFPLNKLIQHTDAKHGGAKGQWTAVDSDVLIQLTWRYETKDWNNKDNNWGVAHIDFSGHTFIPRFTKREGIFYVYAKILANNDAASKFTVDLEVTNPNNTASLKFMGLKVFPVDVKWQEVIKDEDGVLTFDEKQAKKLFLDFDSKVFKIKHKTTIKQTLFSRKVALGPVKSVTFTSPEKYRAEKKKSC